MDPLPFHIASLPVSVAGPLPDWLEFLQQQSIRHYKKGYFTRLEELIQQQEGSETISAYLLWVKIRFLRMRRLYDELPPFMDQARQLLSGIHDQHPDIAEELSFRLQQEHFLMLHAQDDKEAVEQYVLAWKAQYVPDSLLAYRIAMQYAIEDIPQSALDLFPSYYRRKYDLLCWKKGKPGRNRRKVLQQLESSLQENVLSMSQREEEEWFLCVLEYRHNTRQYAEQLNAIRQFIQRRKRMFWHSPQHYLHQVYEFQSMAYEKMRKYRLALDTLNKAAEISYSASKKERFQNDEIFRCLMNRLHILEEVRRSQKETEQTRAFHEELEDDSIRYNMDTKDLSASLGVLERFMEKGDREDTVSWLQLMAVQIRSTLIREEKMCHPLPYEMERFSHYVRWLKPLMGQTLDVEVRFAAQEDDEMIDVPASMLQLVLQQLRAKGKDNQQITLFIDVSDKAICFRWLVQPVLAEGKWSDRRLRRLKDIWATQLDRDVQLQLMSDNIKTEIVISWVLTKEFL